MDQDYTKAFDAFYYAHDCGAPYERNEQWLSFFGGVAERIVKDIKPQTVMDAGCAMGFLVEGFRTRGVECWGVDISEYAIEQVHESVKAFCRTGSITDPFEQKYDLITCIEILEHMPPGEAEKAVENLCSSSDDILFSSTPFDYKEVTHINVHPPEYWAGLFARQGFYRDFEFDASFLTPWAARYIQKPFEEGRFISEYERRFFLLWKENADLRQSTRDLQTQLKQQADLAHTLRLELEELKLNLLEKEEKK
ncbi:MAG: class I SAM-dependent methyltransferase [Anaerolineaceae bacterium]|nr:class I SAM-dependent methyltransferase [Anaerolineaceae bacterium]